MQIFCIHLSFLEKTHRKRKGNAVRDRRLTRRTPRGIVSLCGLPGYLHPWCTCQPLFKSGYLERAEQVRWQWPVWFPYTASKAQRKAHSCPACSVNARRTRRPAFAAACTPAETRGAPAALLRNPGKHRCQSGQSQADPGQELQAVEDPGRLQVFPDWSIELRLCHRGEGLSSL